jgi:hypothetical protein
MDRKLAVYKSNEGLGKVEIWFDHGEETGRLEYYDSNGTRFFTEEFPNKSVHYLHDAAENWASGIKKIETLYG